MATDTEFYYWHDHTPEGVDPVLMLIPREEKPVSEILAWCEDNWPDKKKPHGILLRLSNWNGHSARYFMSDSKGQVNIESIANHVMDGDFIGWERNRPWWESVCEALAEAGYNISLVYCDFECIECYRNYVYKDENGVIQVRMLDVIEYIQANFPTRIINTDLNQLRLDPYRRDQGGQAMCDFNVWVQEKTGERLASVYSDTAHTYLGYQCDTAFYNYASYRGPVMDLASGYARTSHAPGGVSCPVLYVKKDEFYRNVEQAIQALHMTTGDVVIPTVPGAHRVGAGAGRPDEWLLDAEGQQELQAEAASIADKVFIY